MPWDDEVDERSGGLLMAYTGKAVDAFFAAGQFGDVQLNIHVLLEHPEDHVNIPDGIVKNWYSCGPGWEAIKNGAEVTHPDLTKFNGNTDMGKLVKQIQTIDPDGATLSNGTTKEASYWKAISARWEPFTRSWDAYKGRDGQDVAAGSKSKTMPVELLGQPSTNGHAPADFDLAALNMTPEITNALTEVARTAKSYSDFLPKAVSIAGLASTPAWAAIASNDTGPLIMAALQDF